MNLSKLSAFIWSVTDILSGDYKQSEYGRVILPFTVLRLIDYVLAPTKQAVLKEHAKRTQAGLNPEPFLLKAAGHGFYNTSPLDLPTLMGAPDHNGLFTGDIGDRDQLVFAREHVLGAMLESEVLAKQAASNTKEQFASSPDFPREFMNAVFNSMDAQQELSTQALNSQQVQVGLMQILMGPLKLYESLRARCGVGGFVRRHRRIKIRRSTRREQFLMSGR